MIDNSANLAPAYDLASVVAGSVLSRRQFVATLLPQEQAVLYILGGMGSLDTQLATPQEIREVELRIPDLTMQIATRDALPKNSFSLPSSSGNTVNKVAQRLKRLELVGLVAGLAIFESEGELLKRDALEISAVSLLVNHPDYVDLEVDRTKIVKSDEGLAPEESEGQGHELLGDLTKKEQKVARLWHKSSPDIAKELVIEDTTVRNHRMSINMKARKYGLTDDTITVALYIADELDVDRSRIERLTKLAKSLTERQLDCFKLQMRGMTYEEIGNELSISFRTVRTHLHNVSVNLGGKNSRENAIVAHCSEKIDFAVESS